MDVDTYNEITEMITKCESNQLICGSCPYGVTAYGSNNMCEDLNDITRSYDPSSGGWGAYLRNLSRDSNKALKIFIQDIYDKEVDIIEQLIQEVKEAEDGVN